MEKEYTQAQLLDILLNHLKNDPDRKDWHHQGTFKTNEHKFTYDEYRQAVNQLEDDGLISTFMEEGQRRYFLTNFAFKFKGYVHQEYQEELQNQKEAKEEERKIKVDQSIIDTNKAVQDSYTNATTSERRVRRLTRVMIGVVSVQVLVAIVDVTLKVIYEYKEPKSQLSQKSISTQGYSPEIPNPFQKPSNYITLKRYDLPAK